MTATAVWGSKFNYIPSTQDGYSLQEGDELKKVLDCRRAQEDARETIENLLGTMDSSTILSEFLDYARSVGESETYISAFTNEFEHWAAEGGVIWDDIEPEDLMDESMRSAYLG